MQETPQKHRWLARLRLPAATLVLGFLAPADPTLLFLLWPPTSFICAANQHSMWERDLQDAQVFLTGSSAACSEFPFVAPASSLSCSHLMWGLGGGSPAPSLSLKGRQEPFQHLHSLDQGARRGSSVGHSAQVRSWPRVPCTCSTQAGASQLHGHMDSCQSCARTHRQRPHW